jgi:acyl-coenzyme A synthetase/AMP-(fatty) acid ligase
VGEAAKAVVVLKAGARAEATKLIELVRTRKGGVMAPKLAAFAASLPLTPLAKLDKEALRAKDWTTQ